MSRKLGCRGHRPSVIRFHPRRPAAPATALTPVPPAGFSGDRPRRPRLRPAAQTRRPGTQEAGADEEFARLAPAITTTVAEPTSGATAPSSGCSSSCPASAPRAVLRCDARSRTPPPTSTGLVGLPAQRGRLRVAALLQVRRHAMRQAVRFGAVEHHHVRFRRACHRRRAVVRRCASPRARVELFAAPRAGLAEEPPPATAARPATTATPTITPPTISAVGRPWRAFLAQELVPPPRPATSASPAPFPLPPAPACDAGSTRRPRARRADPAGAG